jgi:hypothetical protein
VLLVAVYALRRHIQKRYALQSMGNGNTSVVKMGADGSVTVHKMKMDKDTDTADSKETRSRSIDNEITPPVNRERCPTVLPDINDLDNLNDIHVPDASAPVFNTNISPSGTRITVMYHKPIVVEDFDEDFEEF